MTDQLPLMPIRGVADKPQYSLDGESVVLELIGIGGLRIPLRIPRHFLALFVSRLMRVHLMAESIAAQRGAPAEMPAVEAENVSAQSSYGSPLVALTVLTRLPAIQHFELSPAQADTLALELRDAASEARRNQKTARH